MGKVEKCDIYPVYKSWRIWLVSETQIPGLLGSSLCRHNFHAGLTPDEDFKRTRFSPQVFKAKLKRKSTHKTPQPVFDVERAAQDDWDSLSSSEQPWSSNLHCSRKELWNAFCGVEIFCGADDYVTWLLPFI